MTPLAHVPELALSTAWHEGRFAGPLRTVDGQQIEVIHRGTWTHGFGPDFRDALILFDDRELRAGSVEVHLRTSAWAAHGHQLDPRYGDVVLHVVLTHDGQDTRRSDGALVPILELAPHLIAPLPASAATTADWSRFGQEACAPDVARHDPGAIRAILWRLGDTRLAAKAARIEARLTNAPPAEILYQELWDGLGFHANRAPMLALAETLTLATLESAMETVRPGERLALVRGLLFGVAGFLPLAPVDAAFARLSPADAAAMEALWRAGGAAWHERTLPPTAWTRGRVRPANHPATRLAAGAALLAAARGGLLAAVLAPVRSGGDPVAVLRDLASGGDAPGIGLDRANGLVANAVLPFALALAEQSGDTELADGAARAWERLPAAESNAVTRRALQQVAGTNPLRGLGGRGQQGLIHLDATLCAPRRCYECPIALAVLQDRATITS